MAKKIRSRPPTPEYRINYDKIDWSYGGPLPTTLQEIVEEALNRHSLDRAGIIAMGVDEYKNEIKDLIFEIKQEAKGCGILFSEEIILKLINDIIIPK
jgi:hypothetical protein